MKSPAPFPNQVPNRVPNRVSDHFRKETEEARRTEEAYWGSVVLAARDEVIKEPRDENARTRAVFALRRLHRFEEAIALLEVAVRTGASVDLHHRYLELLSECNRTEEAIRAARTALRTFPDDLFLKLQEALLLPVIYESQEELDRYRDRFSRGLERVRAELRLDTAGRRQSAFVALQHHNNFYLGYQNRNDRDLQTGFGDIVQRILASVLPPAPPLVRLRVARHRDGPLRLGYISGRFRDLSAARFFLGWLRGHDRSRVDLHTWHLGGKTDSVTGEVRRLSRSFAHYPDLTTPELLHQAATSVRDANLDALIYLDIGIDPAVTKMAALRLAPIQCMAWDQPITSGLSTIDYALTGDLAEPANGAEHYSESLVRLPGVGVCYQKPLIPWPLLRKTRRDFGLRDGSVVYLCCQSVFKFLPENDEVFVRIARRVPNAGFVFIVTNALVGEAFRKRIERAFAAAGMHAADHCIVLPQLNHPDYWNLHRVADVFLDTIGWSSGGSIFEAIACRVPVVTLPGEFMRGRQGLAILTQLGVTETIAPDKDAFVDLAVRLGQDAAWRAVVVEKMEANQSRLYSDERSTAALQSFLATVADENRRLALTHSERQFPEA